MKTMKIIILLLLISFDLLAPASPFVTIEQRDPVRPYEALWQAVCQVESTGNPAAYNPVEGAVGIAQIRQCRVDHFNALTGKLYRLQDCYDPDVAREVFMEFAVRLREPERIARKWNGSGPMTDVYWNKIKTQLKP